MTSFFLGLLTTTVLSSTLAEAPAYELRYNGTLIQRSRDGDDAEVKRFSLYALAMNAEDGRSELAFLVDENGGGAWPWPERFGVIPYLKNAPQTQQKIRLLHTHDGTPNPVDLRLPLFEFADKLEPEATWTSGRYAYEVVGTRRVAERDCWEVEASTNFGRAQVIYIDRAEGIVVAADQKVFMGRGDQFQLQMTLESVKTLDADQLAKVRKPVETLAALKNTLNRADNQQTKPELTAAQLEAAAGILPRLIAEAEETPLSRYVAVVSRDVKAQQQRGDDVVNLSRKHVGQPAPELKAKRLDGGPLEAGELSDQIVVLHFWEYQGEPLAEPYGQVGYLDYLNSRRNKLGVKVFGVAVDERLADAQQTLASTRNIRKLKSFMNLSYDILLDDGALVKKFGDPRGVGAKLPLWVVIGADGKIIHHHSGFYEIRPDEGLKALDDLLVQEIRKSREK